MQDMNEAAAAHVSWRDDDVPVSVAYNDAYFAWGDGAAETCEVFINGNYLPERFAAGETFHIGELGFGTGLNFALAVATFETCAPKTASLVYTAFEAAPMSREDTRKSLGRWPDVCARVEAFRFGADGRPGSPHRTLGRVTLDLRIGDIRETSGRALAPVDAWFLDGFSPSKNPEMWSEQLMQRVFDCTRPAGTFSTYTAAGWVRRGLQSAGFQVTRVKGFDRKRERLQGFRSVDPLMTGSR